MKILACCVLAAVLTACAQSPTRTESATQSPKATSPWAAPTSTVRWNEYACDLIARNQAGQFPAIRTLAYLNIGMNNAIIAAQAKGAKPQGAAAGAAATILTYLYPKDEQAIAARLATETAALGANGGYRQDFTAGVAHRSCGRR